PLDLVPLQDGVAVGDEPERDAPSAEVLERLEGLGEEPHHGPTAARVLAGDGAVEAVAGDPQIRERLAGDALPGAHHVHALLAMAGGVAPEPLAGLEHGLHELLDVDS